ncbi:MAG: PIG-L family deacetylase [Bacteroidota bacterium]
MPTALFVSPHLDDAAFSVGGTAVHLAQRGWRVVVATVFTRSVPDPTGFALACQTDKGIDASVDYMAVRRDEDIACCARLGAEPVHLDLPEAPHRGYADARTLFAGVHTSDEPYTDTVRHALAGALDRARPDLVFAPQGIGGHADHRHVVRAVAGLAVEHRIQVAWYRDLPYALRHPDAPADECVPDGCAPAALDIEATLGAKVEACAAYRTQLPFQFARETPGADPETALAAALTLDAREAGRPFGLRAAEVVRAAGPLLV